MKSKNAMGIDFNRNVYTVLYIFDIVIKPILLYAADFWGCLKITKVNPIDTLHYMVCKQVLGVQRKTTNIGVLLEIGRLPLYIDAIKFSVKNWERIRKKQANVVLQASYAESVDLDLQWIVGVRGHLESNSMLSFFFKPVCR